MKDMTQVKEDIKRNIGVKRYEHSIRVMETAKELARHYELDVEKAAVAALLHDCGRFEVQAYLLKYAAEFGIILKDIMEHNYSLIHGPLGAEIAHRWYQVNDDEILNAIRYHTTGRPNMSTLEKIIYMADYIEPNRDFPKVKDIRNMAYFDLDKSLLFAMNNAMAYIIENDWLIDLKTIEARNYLWIRLNK